MSLILQQARGYIMLAKELQASGINADHYILQAKQLILRYKALNDRTMELKLVA